MAESDDGVGEANLKDCGNELDKPSCTLILGAGFTLLMPSTRIARGECAPGKLTEDDAFALIMFFFMVKSISEDGVCTGTEERAMGGCLSGTTLFVA